MKFLFDLFLTFNATSWTIAIFIVKENFTIWKLSSICCATLLIIFFTLVSLISIGISKKLPDDEMFECESFSLADNEFLPIYLGYFFVSVGVPDWKTMLFVYGILFVFTYLSKTQYFNPIFLLFGYHYYHISTLRGTKIFVIARGQVIRNKENIFFEHLYRINNTTYIGRR